MDRVFLARAGVSVGARTYAVEGVILSICLYLLAGWVAIGGSVSGYCHGPTYSAHRFRTPVVVAEEKWLVYCGAGVMSTDRVD